MKRTPPDLVSHLDPNRATTDWIERIAERAQAYLDDDPGRPEAAHLREVIRYAGLAREAIGQRAGQVDAERRRAPTDLYNYWTGGRDRRRVPSIERQAQEPQAGNAEVAAHAAIACIMHAWNAELVMGRAIVRAGLGTKRGGTLGGSKSGKARRGPQSKRERIERALRDDTGSQETRVARIAKRAGATPAYVRLVLRKLAKT